MALKSDALLILLALAGGPLHGYAIIQDVAERSDGEIALQSGALYRTLRRLLEESLIQECARPAHVAGEDERRRYYRLTARGQTALNAEVERMARLVRAARATADGKRPRLA